MGLVGRGAELAALADAVGDAESGRGGVTLVHGEPGIGKSSLARAFAELAAARGLSVAWGRAWEVGGAPTFWPWIEVLRELVASASEDAIGAGREVAPLLDLVPELRERVGAVPELPAFEPAQARFRLFDAVGRLLRRLARERPLALVLDDVHAADGSSLQLLRFLAPTLRASPIALLGAYREVEARLSPDAHEALSHVGREARCLPLARLGIEHVAELAARAGHTDDALCRRLLETTEGNPLFVVEALRLLRARGYDPHRLALPDGVRAVLRERLSLLPGATLELLELGSVSGRELDLGLVALASSMPSGRLRELLDPAVRADVLAPRDGAGDTLVFTHVLLRDELYRGLSAERRARFHRAIGEALEQRVSGDERTRLVGLAHHFIEAAPVAGIERALAHVQVAAERAIELQAHGEAAALLERALRALDLAGDDGSRRAQTLLALGRACLRAGETSRGKDACREAAEIARRRADPDLLVRAALVRGEVFTFALVDPELIALLREALEVIGDAQTPVRARLLGRLAAAMQPHRDPEVPMRLAREAIALARRVGDARERLAVLTSAGSALMYFADPAERVRTNEEIVEIATVVGDRLVLARGHMRLAFDRLEQGDAAAADVHIAAFGPIARELALPVCLATDHRLRAMRATLAGRFDEAAALSEKARALGELADDPSTRLSEVMQRVGLLVTATRTSELAEVASAASEVLASVADRLYARAFEAARAGWLGDARAASRALGEVRDDLDAYRSRLSVCWLAEACVVAEDRELAVRLLPMLEGLRARNHVWGVATMVCDAPVSELLGRLAALLGRADDAVRWLEEALARAERMQARPHVGRIGARLAQVLASRNAAGDAERAAALLSESRELARQLEMPGLVQELLRFEPSREASEAAPAARAADASPSLRAPAAHPAFSLEAQGDYWTVRCGDRETRLKASRGLAILDRLAKAPGREIHVLELVGADDTSGGGDAGEALDAEAIRAYRARIRTLREAIEDAEEIGNASRVARLREEMEALGDELARGVGLGGRARRVASAAERARVNVRRRLVETIGRISSELPELGRHLGAAVRTGLFCSYHPEGRPLGGWAREPRKA